MLIVIFDKEIKMSITPPISPSIQEKNSPPSSPDKSATLVYFGQGPKRCFTFSQTIASQEQPKSPATSPEKPQTHVHFNQGQKRNYKEISHTTASSMPKVDILVFVPSGSPPAKTSSNRSAYVSPPTPRRQKTLSTFAVPFKNISSLLKLGRMSYNNKQHTVHELEGAKGDYLQVYEVTSKEPLIPGIGNDKILIKAFHEERIQESGPALNKYMTNTLKQYHTLTQHNVPIAKIHNVTAANPNQPLDDRFYIVEKIPHAIDTSLWDQNQEYKDLPQKIQAQLDQAKKLFNSMIKLNIEMDLIPSNIRYNDDNQLFLIDFMEEPEEVRKDGLHLLPCLIQALKQWANGNKNILNYLISDFFSINPTFKQKVLSAL